MITHSKFISCLLLLHRNALNAVWNELRKYSLFYNEDLHIGSYDLLCKSLGIAELPLTIPDEVFSQYAMKLGIAFCFNGKSLNQNLFYIVNDPVLRQHVDCSLVGHVKHEDIVEDVGVLYHKTLDIKDVMDYQSVFFDTSTIITSQDFLWYITHVAEDVREMMKKCRANGQYFTRWCLGADIVLDNKSITTGLATDAFFRYKESVARDPDKALKFGNFLMKLIDRDLKVASTKKVDNNDMSEQLALFDLKDDNPKNIGDLK